MRITPSPASTVWVLLAARFALFVWTIYLVVKVAQYVNAWPF